MEVCASPGRYQNVPSNVGDIEALVGTGLSTGLIIDADGIIVFSSDYDSEMSPDEAQFKDGDDRNCGVSRRQ